MTKITEIIISFLLSGFITLFFTKLLIPYLSKYITAMPSKRGLHCYKKPTGGGIVFGAVYLIFSISKGYFFSLISIPLLIIGFIDDKLNIPSITRLIAQTITVFLLFLLRLNTESSFLYFLPENNFLIYLFIIFIGVSIINFINFMDGIDGLVAGCFIVIFLAISKGSLPLITLAGALSGFLFVNWQPSKIFMGDAGSLFLGTVFVSIIFQSNNSIDFLKALFLITPLIADPAITIIRRFFNKEVFWKPHKLHLYQRLVSSGMSHSKVSLIYIFSVTLLSIFYLFFSLIHLAILSLALVIFGFFLDSKFALNFKKIK